MKGARPVEAWLRDIVDYGEPLARHLDGVSRNDFPPTKWSRTPRPNASRPSAKPQGELVPDEARRRGSRLFYGFGLILVFATARRRGLCGFRRLGRPLAQHPDFAEGFSDVGLRLLDVRWIALDHLIDNRRDHRRPERGSFASRSSMSLTTSSAKTPSFGDHFRLLDRLSAFADAIACFAACRRKPDRV